MPVSRPGVESHGRDAAMGRCARMADTVTSFYDGLSDEYHLLFADWDASVRRQGEILDRLIVGRLGPPPHRVLDCACGIGTQAIGLAAHGYRVHGTDISPAAVARAQREAARLGVPLTTAVADMRALQAIEGRFDVVLACDNAVPHLLTDDDLRLAARGMYAKLRDDGLLVVSIRDYDDLIAQKPRAELPRVFDRPDGRQIAFQVWDWDDATSAYTLHQYVLREAGGAWQTSHQSTVYRALQRSELAEIVRAAGFREVGWHLPEETGYYQPILTARRY
jgi:glycine/sarcosine N-methyltransferase